MQALDYIHQRPKEQQQLMLLVRSLFLHSAPAMADKLNYGIPFFYRHSWLAYLNATDAGLDVGFTRGHLLSPDHERLEVRGRKIVRSILLAWDEKPARVEALLLPVIQDALVVDEWLLAQKKTPNKKKKG
jgi:hypothetical protein